MQAIYSFKAIVEPDEDRWHAYCLALVVRTVTENSRTLKFTSHGSSRSREG